MAAPRGARLTAGAAGAVAIAALWLAAPASAATFKVTRANDPEPNGCKKKDCSLREAVIAANGTSARDRIVLPNRKRAYKLTRAGFDHDALAGDLDVTASLVVVHPGKGRATIDANGIDRIFETFPGGQLRIVKLKLTGGKTDFATDGGAIRSEALLVIDRSVISGNEAGNTGGAIDLDLGDAILTRSVLRGNRADNTAGAIRSGTGKITIRHTKIIRNTASGDGGALRLTGPGRVLITDSVIARNQTAQNGGGVQSHSNGPIVIKRSTIARNRAQGMGGGVTAQSDGLLKVVASTVARNRAHGGGSQGGGIWLYEGVAMISNSTITANRATLNGGGIFAEDSALSVRSATVARNVADPGAIIPVGLGGGGLYRSGGPHFLVRSSLIALNRSGLQDNDCEGSTPITSEGNNLLSTRSGGLCEGFDKPSDLVASNPKLGPLKRNGGPTETIGLKRGSRAIGKAHRGTSPKRDQRGRKRDKRPDIGAYERGA